MSESLELREWRAVLQDRGYPTFLDIVRAEAPSTEKAKTWLKEHGQILEEEVCVVISYAPTEVVC